MDNNELQHWGIPGMRWGVRRYQNKDGSLTNAGRKRADKLRKQYLEVTGKKLTGYAVRKKGETVKKTTEPKKKKLSDMSDEELRKAVDRMKLEKDYLDTSSNIKDLRNSKNISKGRYVVSTIADKVITPAAITVGEQAFNTLFAKVLNTTFNLDGDYTIKTTNGMNKKRK